MPDKDCLERREKMTDAELDSIAERLEQRIYENIGKGVVKRFLWIVGIISISVYFYLKSKGIIL